MRMLSLLITLVIVAYLVYAQWGAGAAADAPPPTPQQARQKAAAVEVQVEDQFARQAGQLSRMETGAAAEAP